MSSRIELADVVSTLGRFSFFNRADAVRSKAVASQMQIALTIAPVWSLCAAALGRGLGVHGVRRRDIRQRDWCWPCRRGALACEKE